MTRAWRGPSIARNAADVATYEGRQMSQELRLQRVTGDKRLGAAPILVAIASIGVTCSLLLGRIAGGEPSTSSPSAGSRLPEAIAAPNPAPFVDHTDRTLNALDFGTPGLSRSAPVRDSVRPNVEDFGSPAG